MCKPPNDREIASVAAQAHDLDRGVGELCDHIKNETFVLIGEASHGTQEFYQIRAAITQYLIEHKGFQLVAIEADWPDALRTHRYITGAAEERTDIAALDNFKRFPTWMWRNKVMLSFVQWLRKWNQSIEATDQVGLFGIDLYSLHSSVDAVLKYLSKVDPEAAERARRRYSCFDHFGFDPREYGFATERAHQESCEDEVIDQLIEMKYVDRTSDEHDFSNLADERFYAEQNAKLIANAEQYYRAMFRGRNESWNLRDRHMTDTIVDLSRYYGSRSNNAKVVVWAHNSHLGDSRATEMSERGEWNVGQLMKESYGDQVLAIGFSTFYGTVTAADNWEEDPSIMDVKPGLLGSYEDFFHRVPKDRFWIDLRTPGEARDVLNEERLQRAIGVIYRPATERWSHYLKTRLPDQFDLVIHIDTTCALQSLDKGSPPTPDRPNDITAAI